MVFLNVQAFHWCMHVCMNNCIPDLLVPGGLYELCWWRVAFQNE